jgi:hypothetical protein
METEAHLHQRCIVQNMLSMGSKVANQKSHTFTILQDYGLQVTDYRLSEEIKAKELLHKIT